MRCPKCHYLSFDPEPRCKNCGYDLEVEESPLPLRASEPASAEIPDLPLRTVDSPSRAVTLELVHPAPPVSRDPRPVRVPEPVHALAAVAAEPVAAPARRAPARAPHTTTELPLFVKTIGPLEPVPDEPIARAKEPEFRMEVTAELEEAPMVPTVPPPATRPLSVRRPVADPAKAAPRPERRVGPLHDDLLEDLRRLEREEALRGLATRQPVSTRSDEESIDVPASQRLGAAATDGLLLGGIGAFILWATLRVTGGAPADLGLAALVPMAVFVGGLAVAYQMMFTAAGGQTVGKMLMGIRVVADGGAASNRLTLAQAAGRAVLSPLSVAVLGLGWLPALFGRGLALHDRLAHTRVVRA